MEAGEIQGYWHFGGYCRRHVMQGEADRKESVTGILVTALGCSLPPLGRHIVVQDSAIGSGGRGSVLVVLHRKASAEDTLRAYVHAWKVVSGFCRTDGVSTN